MTLPSDNYDDTLVAARRGTHRIERTQTALLALSVLISMLGCTVAVVAAGVEGVVGAFLPVLLERPPAAAAPPPTATVAPATPLPTGTPNLMPVIMRDFDGVPMAYVPPGCFQMGTQNGPYADEHPAHEQCIAAPFWVDVTEVTNAQYGEATGTNGGPDHPRGNVNWPAAQSHCLSRGARLPTEVEWEYAARGPESLVYPWGDRFEAGVIVYAGTEAEAQRVGSRPAGASWVGALDMIGNLREWTASVFYPAYPYDPTDGREENLPALDVLTEFPIMAIRGGSFGTARPADLRAAKRFLDSPDTVSPNLGFRCVRDFTPGDANRPVPPALP